LVVTTLLLVTREVPTLSNARNNGLTCISLESSYTITAEILEILEITSLYNDTENSVCTSTLLVNAKEL